MAVTVHINPLTPSVAVQRKKKLFWTIFFVQYCKIKKNITPLKT